MQLGRTKLREFVATYGSGRPWAVIDDELGFELAFAGGEFSVLFRALGECLGTASLRAREVAGLLREPARLFAELPSCAGEVLHSVALSAPRGRERGFFRGRTDTGIALDTPVVAVLERLRASRPPAGLHLAGSRADDTMERLYDATGLAVFVTNAAHGDHAGCLVVRRIVVLPPFASR